MSKVISQQTEWSVVRRAVRRTVMAIILGLALARCSVDGILGNDDLPPNVSDPAIMKTPEGAVAAYWATLAQLRRAFGGTGGEHAGSGPGPFFSAIAIAGLLTDELANAGAAAGMLVPIGDADARILPEGGLHTAYAALQRLRGQAGQAIELLKRYAPDSSELLGHLYAVQGFGEILLAELFCSGIPLSTIDFDGDYTLRPGSSTEEVLRHALVLFDSALLFGEDSIRFMHLARVGRARTLLNLGELSQAAVEAEQVPDDYRYTVSFSSVVADSAANFARLAFWNALQLTVSDREGLTGLNFRSSGDPRTRVTARGTNASSGQTIWHPNKYAINGGTPIVLADGIEARLIEAEGALRVGDTVDWLARLNHLRQTAITPALAPLEDPGDGEARIDLLFRERAFWLFLTGHRQGDLRRLVRQYGRSQESVYPTGPYTGGFPYGHDVTLPVSDSERARNPLYEGCLDRGA